MKSVYDKCFKYSLVVLQLSFFASPQAKNDFWPDHLCGQRSKVYISKILSSAQRLQQCSSRNSITLQVTRCIHLVHRQNMETSAEIFFIPAWSEETLLLDLNLHIKNSLLCTKEFSKCRRSSGWKSISVHTSYTNEVTDGLKPAGISLASIHHLLKNNANLCVCSIALVSKIICMILKMNQDLLLTVQTSFVHFLRWGF